MTTPRSDAQHANEGSFDFLVVGAGPAGSVAARELAKRGKRVLLVDKATFPRRKVCGCCLNGNALSALKNVGLGDLPAKSGAVPLTGFTTAIRGRSATISLKGVSLSRESFDLALIEEAKKSGVEFRQGMAVTVANNTPHPPEPTVPTTSPTREEVKSRSVSPTSPLVGEVDSRCESGRGFSDFKLTKVADGLTGSCSARIVIYADGLNGRSSGVSITTTKHSRIGAGVIVDHFPEFYESGRIFMAVGQGGYVGLVRLEDGRLDVAAAFDLDFVRTSGTPGHAAERILKEAGFPEIAGLANTDWKGTPALTRKPAKVAGPNWFTIGDAAGYVEPFTGEGMAWAIGGAAAVVPYALTNDPAGWIRMHRQLIGHRQQTCRMLSRLLRSPGIYGWVVRGMSWFPRIARPLVNALNRPPQIIG